MIVLAILTLASIVGATVTRTDALAPDRAPAGGESEVELGFDFITENAGQAHSSDIRFTYTSPHAAVGFRTDGLRVVLRGAPSGPWESVDIVHAGSRAVEPVGRDELPFRTNYLLGNDPHEWHSGARNYRLVAYPDAYEGVDLLYRVAKDGLHLEIESARGSSVGAVAFEIRSSEGLHADGIGGVVIRTGTESFGVAPPTVRSEGVRRACDFVPTGPTTVTLSCASSAQPVTMSSLPMLPFVPHYQYLAWSTYVGGTSAEDGYGIAVDSSENVYVTGRTASADFPVTAGAFDTSYNANVDAFVVKLNAQGSARVFVTYIGGSAYDAGVSIAVDSSNHPYVYGATYSSGFPVTAGAYDTTLCGGDIFVSKLDASGASLVYSTFLGGCSIDGYSGGSIAVDASGNAYVTGQTQSSDFWTSPGAPDTTFAGGSEIAVVKVNPAGNGLVFSTFLGGSGAEGEVGSSLTIDSSGNVYVAGDTASSSGFPLVGAFQATYGGGIADGFVAKLASAGTAFTYSSYLGGSARDFVYWGRAIAIDASGNAFVTGNTSSTNFPTTAGAFDRTCGTDGNCDSGKSDAFVTKVNSAGNAITWSTYLGGSGHDFGAAVALMFEGPAVTGGTRSSNFPVLTGGWDSTFNGVRDAFVTVLNSAGTALIHSNFLGGTDDDVAYSMVADAAGCELFLTGATTSSNFPTTTGAYDRTYNTNRDLFVTKVGHYPVTCN